MISAGSTILASDFISTPAPGAGDSGKVVKLDAVGKIPTGFMRFGGDGSDGALSVSSGTTTIDLGSAQVVSKNYTSISITGTGKIAFSNPHANGTTIILKSQGNVTLTSSQAPMIDASNCGAAANTNGYGFMLYHTNGATGGTRLSSSTADYASGAAPTADITNTVIHEGALKYFKCLPGAGGGGGVIYKSNSQNDYTATPGAGGRGGGALIIECGGAWNFTTTGGISVSGSNGGNGVATSPGGNTFIWSDGGGGGGAGCFYGFYNTLTANTGTVTASAGSAGSAASAGSPSGNGLSGGTGTGLGYSLVAKNTEYA